LFLEKAEKSNRMMRISQSASKPLTVKATERQYLMRYPPLMPDIAGTPC
jgi:hypothetical protein